jgi:hypothetical protein
MHGSEFTKHEALKQWICLNYLPSDRRVHSDSTPAHSVLLSKSCMIWVWHDNGISRATVEHYFALKNSETLSTAWGCRNNWTETEQTYKKLTWKYTLSLVANSLSKPKVMFRFIFKITRTSCAVNSTYLDLHVAALHNTCVFVTYWKKRKPHFKSCHCISDTFNTVNVQTGYIFEFRTSGDNSTSGIEIFCHDILIREFIQIYAHSCPILRCYKCNMRPYN